MKTRSEYLKPENYEKLYAIMQYQNVLAMRVALETGLRIDDILSLPETSLEGQIITYTASKTGKTGKKRISKDLADKLRMNARGGYIFPGRKPGKHRTRQTVWKDVKKAIKILGINKQISPHSARKTYAVELRKKKGLPAVQRELQHERQETTMIYAFADMVMPTVAGADLDKVANYIADRVVDKLCAKMNISKKQ